MATITSILPNIMAGVDIVGAEKTGLISAVGKDISGEQAAKGQTIQSVISGDKTAIDASASAYLNSNATSVSTKGITINKDRAIVLTYTGDEETGLGTAFGNVLANDFAQAFRTLRNEIEADIAALYSKGTITALGTAGTTPFADMGDFTSVRKALVKAGAPDDGGFSLVVDPNAYAKILTLSPVIANANMNVNSGEAFLYGKLPMVYNMGVGESNAIKTVDDTTDYQANMFFHKNAIQLVSRLPKFSSKGDAALDRTVIADPMTGLNFSIAAYAQHRQISYEVGVVWGVDVIRPEFIGVIKG